MKTAHLRIEGISCAACVRSIETILTSADGTAACTVDAALGQAEIRFDPDRTTAATLAELLTDNGFDTAVLHSD